MGDFIIHINLPMVKFTITYDLMSNCKSIDTTMQFVQKNLSR